MEQIPVLVDELGVARLQNAVYVGLMKFTLDQCNANFDPEEIRRLMTVRNAATPEAQAMKQARAVMDGEYRALILILNSFAVVDDETERFLTIIRALNKNIEYIRKHAMSGATAEDEPQDGGGSDGGETPESTPVTPE